MSRPRDRSIWDEQRASHAELWRMLRREPEQEPGWRDFWKLWVPLMVVVLAVGAFWHPPLYVALGLIAALGFIVPRVAQAVGYIRPRNESR